MTAAAEPLFASVTDAEAESIIRVVLGNADFPEVEFVDAINRAHDACYRVAEQMLDRGDTRISERTRATIGARRAMRRQ